MAVSIPLLICAAPLLLIAGTLIWMRMGRPVLWRQLRPGKNARPFALVKLRTMSTKVNAAGELAPDSVRLSRLGTLLRSWSIDELPELVNVVNGDMSLVGPRPLLMHYLPRYTAEQQRRHDVRPGMTGWAQINGRNNLSWEGKFKLDVWYVENYSLTLDIAILFATAWQVIRRRGINSPGSATADEFKGM